MSQLIDTYLDDLRRNLRCSRQRKAVLLAEARDHLLSAAPDDDDASARAAIARFGPAPEVGRKLSGSGWWLWSFVHWYLYAAMFAGILIALVGASLAVATSPIPGFDEGRAWRHDVRVWRECTEFNADGECTGTYIDREVSATLVGSVLLVLAGAVVTAGHWALRASLLDETDARKARWLFHAGGGLALAGIAAIFVLTGLSSAIIDGGFDVHLVWLPAAIAFAVVGAAMFHGRQGQSHQLTIS